MSRARRIALFVALTLSSLAIAAVGHDRYLARGRTLYVLNHTGGPLRLSLDGRSVEVPPAAEPLTLSLAEGEHGVAVVDSAGASRELSLPIPGNAFERLLGGRVFVLNLGAAAPLEVETASYGPDQIEAGGARLLFGEALVLDRIDLAFAPLPGQGPRGELVRLGVAKGAPAELLGSLPPGKRGAGALDYAAFHLQRGAPDPLLLGLLVETARALGPSGRARALACLRARLDERPVDVPWHRALQDLRRDAGEESVLRVEYAGRARAFPADAALRALAARVAATPDEALAGYEAALALDPAEPWAHHGVGIHAFRRASFALARRHADLAAAALPREAGAQNLRYQVRCAQGEWPALAAELEAARARQPLALDLLLKLLEARVAAGDAAGARAAAQAFRQRVGERAPDDPRQLGLLCELALAELLGSWDGYEAKLAGLRDPEQRRRLRLEAALDRGEGLAAAGEDAKSGPEVLLLALAWTLQGDAAQAARWRGAAAERLAAGSQDERALAAVLAAAAPDPEALRPLALAPDHKAAALLLLALERPALRAAAAGLARRYAFRRAFPGPLLARALARAGAD
ncbi:MAG: hypothetical protein AB7N76_18680 [Planctomycetota bacterium]